MQRHGQTFFPLFNSQTPSNPIIFPNFSLSTLWSLPLASDTSLKSTPHGIDDILGKTNQEIGEIQTKVTLEKSSNETRNSLLDVENDTEKDVVEGNETEHADGSRSDYEAFVPDSSQNPISSSPDENYHYKNNITSDFNNNLSNFKAGFNVGKKDEKEFSFHRNIIKEEDRHVDTSFESLFLTYIISIEFFSVHFEFIT